MINLKDQKLIDAINSLDKNKVDAIKGDIALDDFMIEFSFYISPEALLFLRDNYGVSLRYIFSRINVTAEQMRILLQNGYKPSKRMINAYSLYFGLTNFKMLFEYGIPIPEDIVWGWSTTLSADALTYYLEHGGNPNIRPLTLKSKNIAIYEPSLIDKWVWAQDCPFYSAEHHRIAERMVKTLIQYGAKKSPYAMTWQEDTEYHELMLENPELFKEKISQKLDEIKRHIATISDEDELAECKYAIKKFEEDIEKSSWFLPDNISKK